MLAQHAGVRINIPPLSVNKDEMSITGEKEGVLACKAEVMKIWKEMEKKCSTIQVRMVSLVR
jgi:hypothetical protein